MLFNNHKYHIEIFITNIALYESDNNVKRHSNNLTPLYSNIESCFKIRLNL